MYFELFFVCFFSFATLFLVRKAARNLQLVDRPNSRKLHSGNVPLAGGLSICITLSYFIFSNRALIDDSLIFLPLVVVLTIIGALDDKYDLSVKIRLTVQTLVALLMIYFSGHQMQSLGDLFGFGNLELGNFGYVITIIAVIASINAFNMVDGVDGLLGGLSIVTFCSILFLAYINNNSSTILLASLLIAAIIPFLLMNLGFLGRERKVFMGDSGSMLIGFTVIWLLLSISQPVLSSEGSSGVRPVTALWIIAVPLMDMAAIMFRRIRRGDSPFKPDREHLHHIFQRLGFKPLTTSFIIFAFSAVLASVGIVGELLLIPDYVMFYSFMVLFIVYNYLLAHIWKVSAFIRIKLGISEFNSEQHSALTESKKVYKKAS